MIQTYVPRQTASNSGDEEEGQTESQTDRQTRRDYRRNTGCLHTGALSSLSFGNPQQTAKLRVLSPQHVQAPKKPRGVSGTTLRMRKKGAGQPEVTWMLDPSLFMWCVHVLRRLAR